MDLQKAYGGWKVVDSIPERIGVVCLRPLSFSLPSASLTEAFDLLPEEQHPLLHDLVGSTIEDARCV